MSVIDVRNLRIELPSASADIVDGITFTIEAGELLGLVGESGSGKSTIGGALLGFCRGGTRITDGQVLVDGVDVRAMNADELRRIRGSVVSYVPQDPSASLNPALRVGTQLRETFRAHQRDGEDPMQRVREAMRGVGLPDDDEFLRRFPHQLSGGQQQRVTIAVALICRPKVVVMDEPTTGLDVTTQAALLKTVRDLCADYGIACLYISHDLAVVSELANRVLVLYAGRLAEYGSRDNVFRHPSHPYTRLLFAAIPDVKLRTKLQAIPGRAPAPGSRPDGCFFAPRCPLVSPECRAGDPSAIELDHGHLARCFHAGADDRPVVTSATPPRQSPVRNEDFTLEVRDLGVSYGNRKVLHDVSMTLRSRECLALVGESGSGKTTLSRSIIGLAGRQSGDILFHGDLVAPASRQRPTVIRQRLQYVFQNPHSALNPRKTVGASIEIPLREFTNLGKRARREVVRETLERVALPASLVDAWPSELSGGERQRAAIARSLVCEPEVLICDEITSALDVSVQATIVRLLQRLIDEQGLSILFVTHDLALVRNIADRVCVLKDGRIVETAGSQQIFTAPQDRYTQKLLADTPSLWRSDNSTTALQVQGFAV